MLDSSLWPWRIYCLAGKRRHRDAIDARLYFTLPLHACANDQLFDNALVAAGLLDDPRTMLPRLNKLLELLSSPRVSPAADATFVSATKAASELPSAPNDPEKVQLTLQIRCTPLPRCPAHTTQRRR